RANPVLLLVPCHRVTAARGPGGYVLGAAAKGFLLSLEARRDG
ncbi:MAG: MGMT family protein, partial [Clostridia bacterium]|nr:MGMT family protein [Clostridia bacterium]